MLIKSPGRTDTLEATKHNGLRLGASSFHEAFTERTDKQAGRWRRAVEDDASGFLIPMC